VSLAPLGASANILAGGDGQKYSMSISATAYTTYSATAGA
jgi:hypothetical protein